MPRLPKVGRDHEEWGAILNDFLRVEHNEDGTLKKGPQIAAKYTKPAGGIPESDLSQSVQHKLNVAATNTAAPTATTAPMTTAAVTAAPTSATPTAINILNYGGVGDGGIGIGTISAGGNVVTLINPPSNVAVGQYLKVSAAGPGLAPLITTVSSAPNTNGLTANQIQLATAATTAANGTGVMWGTNNHDALVNALNACVALGGGRIEIPPGGYILDGPISAWPPGVDPLPGDITIWGHGGASQFLMTGGSNTSCTFYRVNSVTLDSLTIRGLPSVTTDVDCDLVFSFDNRQATLRNVWFYGIAAGTGIVATNRTDLTLEGGGFLGCVASGKDVIHCDTWAGLTIRETAFLDFGVMEGVTHAKASQLASYTSRCWVGIFNPQHDLTVPNGGVDGSRCINIDGARFDEGAQNHVLVQPGAPNSATDDGIKRITSVNITGTAGLVLSDSSVTGLNISNVDHLTIRHCHFTAFNSDSGERTAITLSNVRDTKLERVVATTNAGLIAVDATCVSVLMEESSYKVLNIDPAVRLRTILDGQDSANPSGPATIPGIPTITGIKAGNQAVAVSWTAPSSNGGSVITGYQVVTYNASTGSIISTSNTGNVFSFQVTGLTNGVAVYCKVAAVNSVGAGALSAASATVTPVQIAFGPVQQSAGASNFGSAVAASLPSPPTAGNLLVAVWGTQANPAVTAPSGWTQAVLKVQGVQATAAIWYKTADGTETSVRVGTDSTKNQDLQLFEFTPGTLNVAGSAGTTSGAAASLALSVAAATSGGIALAGIATSYNATNFNNAWTNGFVRQYVRQGFFTTAELNPTPSGAVATTESWSGGSTNAAGVLAVFVPTS